MHFDLFALPSTKKGQDSTSNTSRKKDRFNLQDGYQFEKYCTYIVGVMYK